MEEQKREQNFSYKVLENIYAHYLDNQQKMTVGLGGDQLQKIKDSPEEAGNIAIDIDVNEMLKTMFGGESPRVVITSVYGLSEDEFNDLDPKIIIALFNDCKDELKKKLEQYLTLNANVSELLNSFAKK